MRRSATRGEIAAAAVLLAAIDPGPSPYAYMSGGPPARTPLPGVRERRARRKAQKAARRRNRR